MGRGARQGVSRLVFAFVCLFFLSCLASHPKIDQPGLKQRSGGCALSRDGASRVRSLICRQHPEGGKGSRAAGRRGIPPWGLPMPQGNVAVPPNPSPSLKNKPGGHSRKGVTRRSNSREWLMFYYWEEIVSLCEWRGEKENVRKSAFCKDDRVWLKHQ